MFNNRKYINELIQENEELKSKNESKENSIVNLLDANKEFAIENYHLRNKIDTFEKMIKKHQKNECKLNTELCRVKGQLDKLRNFYKIQYGIDILEEEE